LVAVPALAETPIGRLVLVDDEDGTLGKVDIQSAMSGSPDFLRPIFGANFIQEYGEHPTITPDGQSVIYAEANSRNALYSQPLNKSVAPTRITTAEQVPPNATIEFPVVSPDGDTVYFQYTIRNEDGTETLSNDIYSIPIEGGDITRVTHDNSDHSGLDITPDGEYFVYAIAFDHIYVQPVGGGAATPLHRCPRNLCNPDVSPDGTKVAFSQYDGEGYAVYTVPFSTAGSGVATKVPGSEVYSLGNYQSVAFSPDGRYIAYDLGAETRVIPVGGGVHFDFVWGEFNTQSQVVWAPASSDTTAPQFGPLPDITLEATGRGGARWSGLSPEARPKDDVDPNPTLACLTRVGFGVGTAFGRTFPLDSTARVTCTTEDASGNKATASFNITVRDTTAPAISGMPSDQAVEATGASGAQLSWDQPTATDLVDGSRPVSCTPASGSTFPIGETTVRCTATDTRNNTVTKTFKVTVDDTTAPTISGIPDDMSVMATSSSGRVVTYSLPTATDIADGEVNVECAPAAGTTFALGETKVSCMATDDAGNKGEASFSVHVSYDWSGVLQPINSDGSSVFKVGSTVPVRFALRGDSAAVTDAKAKLTVTKIDSGIEGTVLESASTATPTTGNLFRYDAKTGQYVFNWGTKGLAQGTYKLSIDLGDGTADDPQAKNHVLVSLKK
jgi:hypothetical protein